MRKIKKFIKEYQEYILLFISLGLVASIITSYALGIRTITKIVNASLGSPQGNIGGANYDFNMARQVRWNGLDAAIKELP